MISTRVMNWVDIITTNDDDLDPRASLNTWENAAGVDNGAENSQCGHDSFLWECKTSYLALKPVVTEFQVAIIVLPSWVPSINVLWYSSLEVSGVTWVCGPPLHSGRKSQPTHTSALSPRTPPHLRREGADIWGTGWHFHVGCYGVLAGERDRKSPPLGGGYLPSDIISPCESHLLWFPGPQAEHLSKGCDRTPTLQGQHGAEEFRYQGPTLGALRSWFMT